MSNDADLDERIELLRRHVTFMESQCQELERAWKRVPRLGFAAALAIPVGFVWGLGYAVLVVALSGALVITGAYLTGARRSWAKSELDDTRKNLARLERSRSDG